MMLFPNETLLFQCIRFLEIVPLRPRVMHRHQIKTIVTLIFLNFTQQSFYDKFKINKFYLT